MNARAVLSRNTADFGEGENAMTTVTSGQTYNFHPATCKRGG
jgi:hypothetical protein